jgi:hypothetical protein
MTLVGGGSKGLPTHTSVSTAFPASDLEECTGGEVNLAGGSFGSTTLVSSRTKLPHSKIG